MAAEREKQRLARRRRRLLAAVIAAVVVIVVVVAIVVVVNRPGTSAAPGDNPSASSGGSSIPAGQISGPTGPEGVPLEQGTLLAGIDGAASGQTVGGISCDSAEQVAFHIHAHLAIYVDGELRPIPGGIGAVEPTAQTSAQGDFYGASRCYYWLHTHAQDGIIHVEAPTRTTYTLGQFFGVWQQPLSQGRVGPAEGTQTIYVDGKVFTGDPAGIQLGEHREIQINVDSPGVGPQSIDWSKAQL